MAQCSHNGCTYQGCRYVAGGMTPPRLTVTNLATGCTFTEEFGTEAERADRVEWLRARGHYTVTLN